MPANQAAVNNQHYPERTLLEAERSATYALIGQITSLKHKISSYEKEIKTEFNFDRLGEKLIHKLAEELTMCLKEEMLVFSPSGQPPLTKQQIKNMDFSYLITQYEGWISPYFPKKVTEERTKKTIAAVRSTYNLLKIATLKKHAPAESLGLDTYLTEFSDILEHFVKQDFNFSFEILKDKYLPNVINNLKSLDKSLAQRVHNEAFLLKEDKLNGPVSIYSSDQTLNEKVRELLEVFKESTPIKIVKSLLTFTTRFSRQDVAACRSALENLSESRFYNLTHTSEMLFRLAGCRKTPDITAHVVYKTHDDQEHDTFTGKNNLSTEDFRKLTDQQMISMADPDKVSLYKGTYFKIMAKNDDKVQAAVKGREKGLIDYFKKLIFISRNQNRGIKGKIDNIELPTGVYDLIGCKVILKDKEEVKKFLSIFNQTDPSTGVLKDIILPEDVCKAIGINQDSADRKVTVLQVKNYLDNPKVNGYNEPHVLIWWNGVPVEIQISTFDDDLHNSLPFSETSHDLHHKEDSEYFQKIRDRAFGVKKIMNFFENNFNFVWKEDPAMKDIAEIVEEPSKKFAIRALESIIETLTRYKNGLLYKQRGTGL